MPHRSKASPHVTESASHLETRCVYIERDARLAICKSGSWHHLLKTGQLLKANFVKVELSNCLQSLRPVETVYKLSMTSNFGCFASLRVQCKCTYSVYFFELLSYFPKPRPSRVFGVLRFGFSVPEMETGRVDRHRSGRPASRVAGRVEILRPAGQAG